MYKDAEHAREVRTTGSSVASSCRLRAGAYSERLLSERIQNQYFSKEDESALRKLLLKVKKQADGGAIFACRGHCGEGDFSSAPHSLTPQAQLRRRCRTRSVALWTPSWASTSLRRPTSTVRRARGAPPCSY